MFDELERLRESPHLTQLLNHYVAGNAVDVQTWQDRVMRLDGVRSETLIELHGHLLAFEWIEQNTGVLSDLVPGQVARCYRATAAGRRALRRAMSDPPEDDALAA